MKPRLDISTDKSGVILKRKLYIVEKPMHKEWCRLTLVQKEVLQHLHALLHIVT